MRSYLLHLLANTSQISNHSFPFIISPDLVALQLLLVKIFYLFNQLSWLFNRLKRPSRRFPSLLQPLHLSARTLQSLFNPILIPHHPLHLLIKQIRTTQHYFFSLSVYQLNQIIKMKLKRLFCLVPTLVKYPLFHLTSLFIHIQNPNVLPHLQFA